MSALISLSLSPPAKTPVSPQTLSSLAFVSISRSQDSRLVLSILTFLLRVSSVAWKGLFPPSSHSRSRLHRKRGVCVSGIG